MTADADSVTIATVLYGGSETLARTLPSWARAALTVPVRFLFVDNSDDDTARAVVESQRWPRGSMTYLHSGSNVGFAAGANRAIREAKTERVFLLNADVTLQRWQLERVVALDRGTSPVAVSLVTDGRVTAGIDVNAIGWFSDRPVASRTPCLGPSGGAALFDREAFLELGGFTERLFAWGEDAALALRMWAAGIRTSTLDLRLEHSGGHSVASIGGLRRKAHWLARNRVWILRAQYSRSYRFLIGPLMVGLLVLNGVRKVRDGTSAAYFRGLAEGFRVPPPWTTSRPMTLRAHLRYRSPRRPR